MEIKTRKVYEADLMEERTFHYDPFDYPGSRTYKKSVMHLSLEDGELTISGREADKTETVLTMKELDFIRDFLDEVKK